MNILVGNKIDCGVKCVTKEDINGLSEKIGMKYFETSAKEDINVTSTFDSLVYKIIEKNLNFQNSQSFLLLHSIHTEKKKSGCCGKNI